MATQMSSPYLTLINRILLHKPELFPLYKQNNIIYYENNI